MKYLFYYMGYILFSTSCSLTSSVPDKILVNEIATNNRQKAYHNILICGTGSQQSRLMYEKLYPFLNNSFRGKNISTDYVFLGNGNIEIQQLMKKKRYDAYMVLSEKVATTGDKHQNAGVVKSQPGNYEFKEMLAMNIYDWMDTKQPVWDANVKVNFNLREDEIYPTLTRLLIKRLEQNKMFQ